VHIMPWFETKASNPAQPNVWGIHWTMSSRNPDIIDGQGRRQIAAHYYPDIDPYWSGDNAVIEYQLNLMKYAGVDGVFIDWPGTLPIWDYVGNLRNSEAIIRAAERIGLQYAIVYEDHNIKMAADAGFVSDMIGAAQADMRYLQQNYFNNPHYVKHNGVPLLLDFGPQTFENPDQWTNIFSVLNPKPAFYTLWYEREEAGANAIGEFNWIYFDYMAGLDWFYTMRDYPKIGGAYPGFNTYYALGGWPGDPGWNIPVGAQTWSETLDRALLAVRAQNVSRIQLNTWNDYGEGTMLEPTKEFGNQFLTILQQKLGVPFGEDELVLIKNLYLMRKEFTGNARANNELDQAAKALIDLEPERAKEIMYNVYKIVNQ